MSRINIIAYADDIVLLVENAVNIETLYTTFSRKIKNLKLKINTSKFKIILFLSKNLYNLPKSMTLDNDCFEVVKEMKYLGNVISDDLSNESNSHFTRVLIPIFRSFNGLNFDSFLFLFKSYCSPQYGLEL